MMSYFHQIVMTLSLNVKAITNVFRWIVGAMENLTAMMNRMNPLVPVHQQFHFQLLHRRKQHRPVVQQLQKNRRLQRLRQRKVPQLQ